MSLGPPRSITPTRRKKKANNPSPWPNGARKIVIKKLTLLVPLRISGQSAARQQGGANWLAAERRDEKVKKVIWWRLARAHNQM